MPAPMAAAENHHIAPASGRAFSNPSLAAKPVLDLKIASSTKPEGESSPTWCPVFDATENGSPFLDVVPTSSPAPASIPTPAWRRGRRLLLNDVDDVDCGVGGYAPPGVSSISPSARVISEPPSASQMAPPPQVFGTGKKAEDERPAVSSIAGVLAAARQTSSMKAAPACRSHTLRRADFTSRPGIPSTAAPCSPPGVPSEGNMLGPQPRTVSLFHAPPESATRLLTGVTASLNAATLFKAYEQQTPPLRDEIDDDTLAADEQAFLVRMKSTVARTANLRKTPGSFLTGQLAEGDAWQRTCVLSEARRCHERADAMHHHNEVDGISEEELS